MSLAIDNDFEEWLRSRSVKPTPEAYAYARMVWEEARRVERDRCRRLMDRCLNAAWDTFSSEINPK